MLCYVMLLFYLVYLQRSDDRDDDDSYSNHTVTVFTLEKENEEGWQVKNI